VNAIREQIREAVWEECTVAGMLGFLRNPGPNEYYSERVLIGALLGGQVEPGKLFPVRAVDFSLGLHRSIFTACGVVPRGDQNVRLARIVSKLEADGVLGARDSIDEMLTLREDHRGERLGEHIRRVSEASLARRIAKALEELVARLRSGELSAAQAEELLRKRLR
jgi:replicative DNA helicase